MRKKRKQILSGLLAFILAISMVMPVWADGREEKGVLFGQEQAEETVETAQGDTESPEGTPDDGEPGNDAEQPVHDDVMKALEDAVAELVGNDSRDDAGSAGMDGIQQDGSTAELPEPEAYALADLEFDENKTYAFVKQGDTLAMNSGTKATWDPPGHIRVEATYDRNSNELSSEQAQFKIKKADNQGDAGNDEIRVSMSCLVDGGEYPVRAEGTRNDAFADPQGRFSDLEAFYFLKKVKSENDVMQVKIRADSHGRYATVDDGTGEGKGELRFAETTGENDAQVFEVYEFPDYPDTTVSIEHKGTKKYIKTYGEDGKPLTVDGSSGDEDTIFSKAVYGTNKANTVDDKEFAVVSFVSKEYKNGLKSVDWKDGPNAEKVLTTSVEKATGGWESMRVVANGDGTVSFKDSCLDQYITVKENELRGGIIPRDTPPGNLTDNEKFILHTKLAPQEITGLSIDDSSRSESTLQLSWQNPKSLFSGIEVYRKKDGEAGYEKIEEIGGDIGGSGSYTATGLEAGTPYSFKLRVKLYNGENDLYSPESAEVSASTRAGAKPAIVPDVQFEQVSEGQYKIIWKAAENAKKYQIQCAPSRFGKYKEIGEPVDAAKTEAVVSLEESASPDDKYGNYYRVIAVNGNEKSDPSAPVALETELFGDHTIFFAPTDDFDEVDQFLLDLFDKQNDYDADAQFNGEQWQVYFKKGDYTDASCMYLGFYTSFNGLGKTPQDVKLNNIAIPAYLPGGALGAGENNATCNFWRSAENLSVINTGNAKGKASKYGCADHRQDYFNWAVAQAAPLRRVYSTRQIAYDWNYGWASGGYVADCWIANDNAKEAAGTWSGQQFFTRNTKVNGGTYGTTLNNFFMGVEAANNLIGQDKKEELSNKNGYTNWGFPMEPGDDGKVAPGVVTEITETPRVSEKPFLYLENGEYKIFVPDVQENRRGISWGEGKANSGMGEGKSLPLDDFYIAEPTDTAAEINTKIADGKNIYFTPGTYHAETPIVVDRENAILLGSGMASIIPDNEQMAMRVGDKDGIRIEGLIFDAGLSSEYLLKVGEKGESANHSANPIILQDLFFRVGGTTDVLTKADDALEINCNDVIGDHFWIWRADHGAGVEWFGNESKHGLIVNGDRVKCYALFNEHFQEYHTLWNGEDGATYFYQNETCYDPISQEAWMSHGGKTKGYSSYKVSNDVKNHYAVGLGVYNVFIYTGPTYQSSGGVGIELDNAIEVPNAPGVLVENACTQTFANSGDDDAYVRINHIVNGVGGSVSSGTNKLTGEKGEGWSRKYLLSYNNSNAKYGKETDPNTFDYYKNNINDQRGQFIGVEEKTNIEPPKDEFIDVTRLQGLYTQWINADEKEYTERSWKKAELAQALAGAKSRLDEVKGMQTASRILRPAGILKMSGSGKNQIRAARAVQAASQSEISETQSKINKACSNLEASVEKLIYIGGANILKESCDAVQNNNYNAAQWDAFQKARANLDKALEKLKEAEQNSDKEIINSGEPKATTKADIYSLQKEIDKACEELAKAAKDLNVAEEAVKQLEGAGMDALKAACEKYSGYVQSDYTQDTWENFAWALESAQAIQKSGNAEQFKVKAMIDALESAAAALKKNSDAGNAGDSGNTGGSGGTGNPADPGNSTGKLDKLKKAYDTYSLLKQADYTADSWKAFAKAMDAAKLLLSKGEAGVSQQEADLALMVLETSAAKLVRKGSASGSTDTASLEQLLALYNQYLKLNQTDYTKESWQEFQKAMAEIKSLMDTKKEADQTQAKVDAMLALMEAAVMNLVNTDANTAVRVESLTLNKKAVTLNKGEIAVLTAKISPVYADNQNVIWSSGNTAAATVDANGVVKAVGKGTAKITATTADGGKTAVCKVTVKIPATKITLNTKKLYLVKGKSLNLKGKMKPIGTTDKIKWKSSKVSVASVKNGKVTAKKAGTVKITAKTTSGKKAVCTVFVVKRTVKSVSVKPGKSKLTVKKGSWKLLRIVQKPVGTTDQLKWSSSDASVARVDRYGFVTGKKKGTAVIRAITPDGKKAKCKVTVK